MPFSYLIPPRSTTNQQDVAITRQTVTSIYDMGAIGQCARLLGNGPLSTDDDGPRLIEASTATEFKLFEALKHAGADVESELGQGYNARLYTPGNALRNFLGRVGGSGHGFPPAKQPGECPHGFRLVSSYDHLADSFDLMVNDLTEDSRMHQSLGSPGSSSKPRIEKRLLDILALLDMILASSSLCAVLLVIGSRELAEAVLSVRPKIACITGLEEPGSWSARGRVAIMNDPEAMNRDQIKHAMYLLAESLPPSAVAPGPVTVKQKNPARRISKDYDVRISLDSNVVGEHLQKVIAAVHGHGRRMGYKGCVRITVTPTVRQEVLRVFGFDPAESPLVHVEPAEEARRLRTTTVHGRKHWRKALKADGAILAEIGAVPRPMTGQRRVNLLVTQDVVFNAIASHTGELGTDTLSPFLVDRHDPRKKPFGFTFNGSGANDVIDRSLRTFCG